MSTIQNETILMKDLVNTINLYHVQIPQLKSEYTAMTNEMISLKNAIVNAPDDNPNYVRSLQADINMAEERRNVALAELHKATEMLNYCSSRARERIISIQRTAESLVAVGTDTRVSTGNSEQARKELAKAKTYIQQYNEILRCLEQLLSDASFAPPEDPQKVKSIYNKR